MPPKRNKAGSSTARQTRSVTRARNSAAQQVTPNWEVISPPRPNTARPAAQNRDDVSPPRSSIARSNSLARSATQYRYDVSPPRPSTPMLNSSARPTPNREDVSPPRPNTALSSHYAATPNIRNFCHTASPAGAHNTLASRYVPTPPNFLDSRRATSPGVVHNSAFSFRHSSPPLMSTNLAQMQNAFSFRHTASPLNGRTPAETHSAFSFRHTNSPLNVFSRHACSPPGRYNGMQASHLSSPHVPTPVNDRFHHARPSSLPVPTPLNSMSSRVSYSRPSFFVPMPLNDRSPRRFCSPRLSSPPVPTPLYDRPPSPLVPTSRNCGSPRFLNTRLDSHDGPSSSLLRLRSALASRYVVTPPGLRNGLASRSGQESHPRRMSNDQATFHDATSSRQRNESGPRRMSNDQATLHEATSSRQRNESGPRRMSSDQAILREASLAGQRNESGTRRMSSDQATLHEASLAGQRNAFNITVDLTDSPLAAATQLNATVDLTYSPFNTPVPPMENTGGASLAMENSPAATPGTSRIRCPVCLDSHSRISSSGRSLMSTVCGHIFCSACLPTCIRSTGRCPTCRRFLRPYDVHPVYI